MATAAVRHEAARPRWLLFLGLAAAVVALDQLSKAWIVASIQPGESISVVGDLVRLIHSRNSGGLFGAFQDAAPVFAVVSVGVIGLIVWYHGRSGPSWYLSIALGLLLGGAIGNLIDRIRYGYVVDFVDAGIGNIRFYTFNLADAAISCALLLLVLASVRPSLAAGTQSRSSDASGD